MWVVRSRFFRPFLNYYEECNKSAISYATRMPGAQDLYPFLHQSIVSSIKNDPVSAELHPHSS